MSSDIVRQVKRQDRPAKKEYPNPTPRLSVSRKALKELRLIGVAYSAEVLETLYGVRFEEVLEALLSKYAKKIKARREEPRT